MASSYPPSLDRDQGKGGLCSDALWGSPVEAQLSVTSSSVQPPGNTLSTPQHSAPPRAPVSQLSQLFLKTCTLFVHILQTQIIPIRIV